MIFHSVCWQDTPYKDMLEDGAAAIYDAALHMYRSSLYSAVCSDRYDTAKACACDILRLRRPNRILHTGGGCAMDTAVISYLKELYSDMTVFWFDAHPDFHTPETSVSGSVHGMAAGLLTCENGVCRPSDLVFCCDREADEAEEKRISGMNIRRVAMAEDLPKAGGAAYIHVDFDVFSRDSIMNAKNSGHGGISCGDMMTMMEKIASVYDVLGISLLENTEKMNRRITDLLSLSGDILGL